MTKPIAHKLPNTLDHIDLHILADWHVGDPNCDLESIKAQVEEVRSNPKAYCVLGGDLINNATKSSVSDIYSEALSPMTAMSTLVDLLSPIKDRILAATGGNHELRTYREDGLDITRLVCRELGIEKLYRMDFAIMFLKLGSSSKEHHPGRQVPYTIYMSHGRGGGAKIGGKANRLADSAAICDADLFIVGHTHQPMTFKDTYLRCTPSTMGVEAVERTYVNTAASLDYGGYGAAGMFRPGSKSYPVVRLDGRKRDITVRL